jgi:hypothetical protein
VITSLWMCDVDSDVKRCQDGVGVPMHGFVVRIVMSERRSDMHRT